MLDLELVFSVVDLLAACFISLLEVIASSAEIGDIQTIKVQHKKTLVLY